MEVESHIQKKSRVLTKTRRRQYYMYVVSESICATFVSLTKICGANIKHISDYVKLKYAM